MHPKIKNRPAGDPSSKGTAKPLMLHDVTKQTASANAASRRSMVPNQPASGSANHSRHHVSQSKQA